MVSEAQTSTTKLNSEAMTWKKSIGVGHSQLWDERWARLVGLVAEVSEAEEVVGTGVAFVGNGERLPVRDRPGWAVGRGAQMKAS